MTKYTLEFKDKKMTVIMNVGIKYNFLIVCTEKCTRTQSSDNGVLNYIASCNQIIKHTFFELIRHYDRSGIIDLGDCIFDMILIMCYLFFIWEVV